MTRKIVHVLWNSDIGGIERFVHDLATAQRRLDLHVRVAFGHGRGRFARALAEDGLDVVDLAFGSGFDLRLGHLVRAARLIRDADVVHLHGFNLPLGLMCMGARRPIVFTEHGNFGLGRKLRPHEFVKRCLQRRFLAHFCTQVVANSRYTASRLTELYGLPPSRVVVIYNGIAPVTDDVSARPRGAPVAAGFVGRLVAFKRVDRMLYALARASRRADLHLTVIGGGPLESELRALADELLLDGSVEFLGYREDVDELLRGLDILVHPSQNEPFGLALVEACARGVLPIVFSDGAGALEVLPPDGLIVGSINELAATFDALVASPALSEAARRARAEWASSTFSIERAAMLYSDLYEDVAMCVG